MYSLYPTNTSERASFTKVPGLKIYMDKYFLPVSLTPQIPPIFHF